MYAKTRRVKMRKALDGNICASIKKVYMAKRENAFTTNELNKNEVFSSFLFIIVFFLRIPI